MENHYNKTFYTKIYVQKVCKQYVMQRQRKRGCIISLMSDNLNVDLKDNQGKFNCGKPTGYIKDFKSCLWKHRMLLGKSKEFVLYLAQYLLVGSVDERW